MTKRCPRCKAEYDDQKLFCPRDGGRLEALNEYPLVGTLFADRYEIEAVLGSGGMGVVYRAVQRPIGRQVALKVLHEDWKSETETAKRFLREARAMSRLDNRHTIRIYDFDRAPDGTLYLAMELLKGVSLRDHLEAHGAIPVDEAVRILEGIADSLAEAHAKQIVHRDLKPENVFLCEQGEGEPALVKVIDFGLARLQEGAGAGDVTQAGMVLGTPAYMSPEMVLGEETGAPADIYAAGIMLYEMLAGVGPFQAKNVYDLMRAHAMEDPATIRAVKPGVLVPPALNRFMRRCLAKRASDRPADAGEFREELKAARGKPDGRVASERLHPIYVTGDGHVGMREAVGVLSRRYPAVQFAVEIVQAKPATEAGAADEQVTLRVESEPAGADIWAGSFTLGRTPATIKLPRQDQVAHLELRVEGYVPLRVSVSLTRDVRVSHTLVRRSGGH